LTIFQIIGRILPVPGRKNKKNQRVTQVVVRNVGGHEASPAGRIMLSPETATVVRALAKHTRLTLDDLVQWMIQDFVPRHLPELDLVLDDGTVRSPGPNDGGILGGAPTIGGTSIFGMDTPEDESG
jgi:hypothetical protein